MNPFTNLGSGDATQAMETTVRFLFFGGRSARRSVESNTPQPGRILRREIDQIGQHRYSGVVRFEWDDAKDEINQKKHGVAFEVASRVFADPNVLDTSNGWLKVRSAGTP